MSAVSDEREEAEQHPQEDEVMRTEELMREYAKDAEAKCPSSGWQSVVWHAASLLRLARQMRNTVRKTCSVKPIDEPFVQDDLFGNC